MSNEHEELKALLRRNLELNRENNRLLKKIRRNSIFANIVRVLWFATIIGVPVFLYYYVLEPYLNELATAYQSLQDGAYNVPLIGDFLERFADSPESLPSEVQ